MKGYKATNKDMKCMNFKYKVGGTYTLDGDMVICKNGFHFCEKLLDVYNYYPRESDTRVFEVEALGEVISEGDKSVTNKIKIVREITVKEILDTLFNNNNTGNRNTGHYNTGDRNTGHYNTGHYNTGDQNTGDRNTGHYNTGDRNTGDRNTGHYNTGNYNTGQCNTGNYNTGHYNTGHYNTGHYNTGFFNTNSPNVRLFNKETNLKFSNSDINKLYYLNIKPILRWVISSNMTEQEKLDNPSHKITGGFLKHTGKTDWSSLTDDDKELIKSLPGYDDNIFKEITGISLLDEYITVVVNGENKQIKKDDAIKLGLI